MSKTTQSIVILRFAATPFREIVYDMTANCDFRQSANTTCHIVQKHDIS